MLSINRGDAIASEAKGLIATCLFINISMLKELIVPLTSRVVSFRDCNPGRGKQTDIRSMRSRSDTRLKTEI